jgi:hypothetical protein
MRARNLKPGFFLNEELLECTPLARILFAGLWCMADREGRLEDRPKRIKVSVLPGDDCDVDELLRSLHDHKLIERYEVDGKRYILIPKFLDNQRPHHTEKESILPPSHNSNNPNTIYHSGESALDSGESASSNVRNPPSSLNPSSLNPSSLNPSSLNPSSLNPSSLNPSSLNPSTPPSGEGCSASPEVQNPKPPPPEPAKPPAPPPEPAPDFATSPEGLAQAWRFHLRRPPTRHDDLAGLTTQFREWTRLGAAPAAILAAIIGERDHTEPLWDFKARLMPRAPPGGRGRRLSNEEIVATMRRKAEERAAG